MPEIPPTVCRDCVFTICEANTQVGCKFDRIEKFSNNGANIQAAYDEDGKEFYIIEGRFCDAKRTLAQMGQVPKRKWKSLVEREIRIRCDIIILINGETTLEDVKQTVEDTYNQTLPPQNVVLVIDYHYKKVPVRDFLFYLRTQNFDSWKIEEVCSEEVSPIDVAVKSCKGIFYTVFNAGSRIPQEFIEKLNYAKNEKMIQFLAVLPDDYGNGLTVQRIAHLKLNGYKEEDLVTKLYRTAEEEGFTHLIKNYEDIHAA